MTTTIISIDAKAKGAALAADAGVFNTAFDAINADPVEAAIAALIVDQMIAAGATISVDDGGEWVVTRSRDVAAIAGALASSDGDSVLARNPDTTRIGRVWLVWGNGCDLIGDYTDTPGMCALMERPMALARDLEG